MRRHHAKVDKLLGRLRGLRNNGTAAANGRGGSKGAREMEMEEEEEEEEEEKE